MTKKPTNVNADANVIKQNITHVLESNYMPYTMSVIVSRAIPEIDGFKPAHRKLLYTMYKMGLLKGGRRKSADVVGQTMQLNPHGDASIYETMVRLTRGYDALLHPFVDSKGNFGKVYSRDMAYAASRYTEVKLADICSEIFFDIDKNTVDFIDNYNGTMKEPVLLPTTFPNLLVTPNQGIAVGMASSIASFNLKEVCTATIEYIKDKNTDLKKHLLGPDFSTGGQLIYNEEEIDKIYKTGRGGFKLRAKYRYDKKNSCIEIYEIPYTTTQEAICDKIITLVKSGKIKEITEVRDETDLKGLKIALDIRKSADPDTLMQKLFAMTPLVDTFSCNFNILINGRPKTMGIAEILDEWIIFRTECIRKQLNYDIKKTEEKLHLLEGLSKILLDIDKAIKIIRNTEQDNMVIPNLMEGFQIDTIQAEYIADIRLRNLNKEYLLNRINEKDNLENLLADLKATIESDKKIHSLISASLKNIIKKYQQDRRTEIIYEEEIEEISVDIFIEDYGLKLFLTAEGYFKKIPLISLRSASDHKFKEDDYMLTELESTNKADILFFSSQGSVYKARAYDLPDCKASLLGEYLPNLLDLSEGEKIIYMTATLDYSGYMIFAFENGKIAKIKMDSYQTKVNRKKLLNAYSLKSRLIFADYIYEDRDYIGVRDTDKATLFSTALIEPKQTKNSSGVQFYNLKKNSVLSILMPSENFKSDDIEYYRTNKIPSTGHFITENDKRANDLEAQIKLF